MIKKIAIALLIIIGGFAITLWAFSESRPTGKQGPEADALANKMLKALNYDAWNDLSFVKWDFKSIHQYEWDKKNNRVEIKWDDTQVNLNLDNNTGVIFKENKEITDETIIKKAIEYFYNDSFWLAAPFKVFDEGTKRSIVDTDEGKALLVTYTSGGVTPGDAYLWFIDEKGFPYKYKMWASIIPIGGLEFTWEDWEKFDGGVWLPQNHEGIISIRMTSISTKP